MWRRRSGIGSWIGEWGLESWVSSKGREKITQRSTCMLICAQLDLPQRRTIINLVPADLPKEDGQFDLAIALGILAASGQIDAQSLDKYEFLGELALTGQLRGVDGALPAAIAAARDGRSLIVAAANSEEAALAQHADVRVARTLLEVCSGLETGTLPPAVAAAALPVSIPDPRDLRASCRRAGRWKSRPPADTTCCCSARRIAARRCWRRAFPVSCLRPASWRRWRRRPSPPAVARALMRGAGGSGPTGRRTIRPARWR